ncbi:MAG TPA: hypothetical protein PLY32_00165 [Salinivirgaceae bacterium]|nr:hypothetical protein [Salinivirgaceae bacterium]HQA75509.1 hypothetical protein [Salinivirgaceae bacterium]
MKKIIILGAIVALLAGCASETKTKRELKGYRFQNEYAVSDPVEDERLTKDITIDMYIMMHAYPRTWSNVIAKGNSKNDTEFCFRIKDSKEGQYFFGDGVRKFTVSFKTDELFKLNRWQRITLVRDMKKGEQKIYANGELVHKQRFRRKNNKGSQLTNMPIRIGCTLKRGKDMTVADVKIWSKVMPDSVISIGWGEVENLNADKSLVAYWSFEDLVGKKVENLADSDLTLTIKRKK